MNNRLLIITTLISLALHATLLLSLNQDRAASSTTTATVAPQVTRVVFKQAPKPVPTTPVQKVASPPKKSAPKPVVKSSRKPAPKVEKTQQKQQVEETQIAEQNNDTIEPPAQPAATSPPSSTQQMPSETPEPVISRFMAEEERQRYLSHLLAHIETYKYYPRIARKRGIEGDVIVSFIVSAQGEVKNINISGGPSVLRKAAHKAVNTSLPLPKPPKELEDAMPIKYKMVFALSGPM